MRQYHMQLVDNTSKEAIGGSGGLCLVTVNGSPKKLAIYNKDGSVKSNPFALSGGALDFYTTDDVAKVDVFVQAPSGHMVVKKNVIPSGDASLPITRGTLGLLVIPFSILDTAANTETDVGFVVPPNAAVIPQPVVEVTTNEASRTIAVGTLSSQGGTTSATGFATGVSLANAGPVKPTLAFGAVTMGAKLQVNSATGSTAPVPECDVTSGAKKLSYTLSASTVSAAGYIKLPIQFAVSNM